MCEFAQSFSFFYNGKKMAEKKASKTNLLDELKPDKTESPLDFLCKYWLKWFTVVVQMW